MPVPLRRLVPAALLLLVGLAVPITVFAQAAPSATLQAAAVKAPSPLASPTPSPSHSPTPAATASPSPAPAVASRPASPAPAVSSSPSPASASAALPAPASAAAPALSPQPTPGAASPAAPPGASDPRTFPQTGFRIDQDAFWDYFSRRGGVDTFGYPVSQTFTLLGTRVQLFQRLVLQLRADGTVGTLNLLDQGLLPFTRFNGSTFPAADPSLAGQVPSPSDPTYLTAVTQFVQANAPDTFDGHPVNFSQTFFSSVPADRAFPDGPPADATTLLAGFDLEIWGLPTSKPMYDPANHNFIYQRFQRGIMHYDAGCNCTHGLLLADYLKALLLNQNVPSDLAAEAHGSNLLAQWTPGKPGWLARPAELPGTDLTNAFVGLSGSVPAAAIPPSVATTTATTLVAGPPVPPAPPAAVPSPSPGPMLPQGYDVSFPQCGHALPSVLGFTILGVNGGRAFESNPCLATLEAWALGGQASAAGQPRLSFYLNTGNPGPDDPNQQWPAVGTTTPQPCDGSPSVSCAYDYGWNAAQTAFSKAGSLAAGVPWWLDVETANTWSDDTTSNVADLQGAVAYLKSAGVATIGIYSSPRQWAIITGATSPTSPANLPFSTLPNWVAGAHSPDEAPAFCSHTFTGGRVKLVQYPADGFDADYVCF